MINAMLFIVIALTTIILLDAVLDIVGNWIEAIRLYRDGWRVRRPK